MNTLDYVVRYGTVLLLLVTFGIGCNDLNIGPTGNGGGQYSRMGLQSPVSAQGANGAEHALFWTGSIWDFVSAFEENFDYWAGSQYAIAGGQIRTGLNESGKTVICSAELIGDHKLVSAHHCMNGQRVGTNVGFVPTMLNDSRSDITTVKSGLRKLGFRGTSVNDVTAIVRQFAYSAPGKAGEWKCTYTGQDGTRDVAYFECLGKWVTDQTGRSVQLFPGTIFGYFDVHPKNPSQDTDIYYVSVNKKTSTSSYRTLISPGGRVQMHGGTSCAGGYSHCSGTQGANSLPGSSGGGVLTNSDDLLWAVINGYRPDKLSERHRWCHNGFLCWPHKDLVSRFTSEVYNDRFWLENAALSTANHLSLTSFATDRFEDGSLGIEQCRSDEAMIGVVGTMIPVLGMFPRVITLGSVCGAMWPGGGLFLPDSYYVQVLGGYDTDHLQTPPTSSANRMRLNRYVKTVPSIWDVLGSGQEKWRPQRPFLCPAGRAVYKVVVHINNDVVVGISSIGCRDNVGGDVQIAIPDTALGSQGYNTVTLACDPGDVAVGLWSWVGEKIDNFALVCRDF